MGVGLALCTGCYSAVLVPFQTSSSLQYKISDRSAVCSRALSAFQGRGQLIAMSDPVGGLVRTENQPLWTVCSNTPEKKCLTREHDQLTIGTDGSAFLRRYYVVRGNVRGDESPYSDRTGLA